MEIPKKVEVDPVKPVVPPVVKAEPKVETKPLGEAPKPVVKPPTVEPTH